MFTGMSNGVMVCQHIAPPANKTFQANNCIGTIITLIEHLCQLHRENRHMLVAAECNVSVSAAMSTQAPNAKDIASMLFVCALPLCTVWEEWHAARQANQQVLCDPASFM